MAQSTKTHVKWTIVIVVLFSPIALKECQQIINYDALSPGEGFYLEEIEKTNEAGKGEIHLLPAKKISNGTVKYRN